jgi:hypothetical protein
MGWSLQHHIREFRTDMKMCRSLTNGFLKSGLSWWTGWCGSKIGNAFVLSLQTPSASTGPESYLGCSVRPVSPPPHHLQDIVSLSKVIFSKILAVASSACKSSSCFQATWFSYSLTLGVSHFLDPPGLVRISIKIVSERSANIFFSILFFFFWSTIFDQFSFRGKYFCIHLRFFLAEIIYCLSKIISGKTCLSILNSLII